MADRDGEEGPAAEGEAVAWCDTATIKEGATVKLAEEVRKFCAGCEGLLSAIAMNRPLTADEAQLIDQYCKEVCKTIESRLPQE